MGGLEIRGSEVEVCEEHMGMDTKYEDFYNTH